MTGLEVKVDGWMLARLLNTKLICYKVRNLAGKQKLLGNQVEGCHMNKNVGRSLWGKSGTCPTERGRGLGKATADMTKTGDSKA